MPDIDMFETREMIDPLNTMFEPRSFLLDTFFSTVETHDVEAIDVEIHKGKRRLAPFVSPRSKGRTVKRDSMRLRTYKPPYLKPKRACDAEMVLKRGFGQPLYGGVPTPEERAAKMLADDLVEMGMEIERREEWMAAHALFTGKIIVSGIVDDGDESSVVDDEIDFQMSASNKIVLTGAALWSDAASSPINNLRAWRRLVSQNSGRTARVAVMGSNVVDKFVDNASVKAKLDNRRIDMGIINPQELPDGVTYWGYLGDPGIDIYTYDEWYVDDDGNEQPMVPVNKIMLGATNAMTKRHYGPIRDLDAIDDGVVEARYYPKSWKTKDPSQRYVMVQSAPLVVPHEIDAFLHATVV